MMKSKRLLLARPAIARWLSTTAAISRVEAEAGVSAAVRQRGKGDSLYWRLSALGGTSGTAAEVLNQIVKEGKMVMKTELDRCICELRKYGKYHHALQIMEWMDAKFMKQTCSDYAKHLDLISKTRGIVAAKNYFRSLSESSKNHFTYGALLNCYCKEKMVDEALALFKKMDELNFTSSSLTFNNLMSLYMRVNQPEKVPPLFEEMRQRNIAPTNFSYSILMNSYSCLNDIPRVEKVFEEMKENGGKACDWTTYSNLAAVYIKAGLRDKAESALKKVEEVMGPADHLAYRWLITLYAGTSNLSEVHRVWNSMKTEIPVVPNLSYLMMLQALARLDDIDGLIRCFEEWKASHRHYDMRIVNVAVLAYLKNDMISEAKSLLDESIGRSKGPFFTTWGIFMEYYLKQEEMDSALKCLEEAVSRVKENEWRPRPENVEKFLKIFRDKKDVDGAEKLCDILKKVNCVDEKVYQKLIEVYIAAGVTAPDMPMRLEADGIRVTTEMKNLLGKVSPE